MSKDKPVHKRSVYIEFKNRLVAAASCLMGRPVMYKVRFISPVRVDATEKLLCRQCIFTAPPTKQSKEEQQ